MSRAEDFKRFQKSRSADETWKWEHGRVRWLCARLGVGPKQRRAIEEAGGGHGGPARLTFAEFCRAFPEFPLWLAADRDVGRRLHVDPKAVLPRWFSHFHALPFVRAWEYAAESKPPDAGRPTGLVFPRKGVPAGLVVHDADSLIACGPSFLYPYGEGGAYRLTVQRLADVADFVRRSADRG